VISPTAWRRIVVAAAAIHLSMAAFFSTHWQVDRFLPAFLDRPLKIYGAYTGARTHFNFFAPTVSTQARAQFVLARADGTTYRDSLATGSGEADQRVAMMFTYYGVAEARPFLARSWAVHMLNRHPDAVAVDVSVEVLEIPTLAEIKQGRTSRWIQIDHLRLRRDEIA
jgi:hypothetical protein